MTNKANKEPNKNKKKRALINAAVPREKSIKQGGAIATTVTPNILKMVKGTKSSFDEQWQEGQPARLLEHTLGSDVYKECI